MRSTKMAELLLRKSGRTVEDLNANSNLGKLFKSHGVRRGPEFDRIKALPTREWESSPQTQELVELLTDAYKTPSGTQTLRPVQAVILQELHDFSGCMGVARVGSGKTLISALAPVVVEASRPLYLGPAKLMEKTQREFRKLAEHWRIARNYTFLSYEKLSNVKYYAGYLDRLQPDFICCEEGHYLGNAKSTRCKVLGAYLKKHPRTVVLDLTGTWQRNSVKNGAHIADWCLGEYSPLPRSYVEAEEWSGALDHNVEQRLSPGVLKEFCSSSNPTLDEVRAAFGKRVTSSPGFVTVRSSDCDATLILQGEPFNEYKSGIDKVFTDLRASMETPDGVAFTEPIQLWNYLRQCQCEFHYYYDPPPPQEWRDCRRAWGQFVREALKGGSRFGLLSEWQVANACAQGRLESYGLWDRWKAVKPTYEPEKHRHTSWFGSSAVEHCAGWLSDSEGVLFTPYVAVGEHLQELTGLPYFANLGVDKASGKFIDDHKGPCIASISANKEGRNLQHFNRAMLVGGIGNSNLMEQLLGRLHRSGQPADEVVFDVFFGCIEALSEIHQAKDESAWQKNTAQDEFHKLLVADVLLPTLEEAEKFTGPRWSKEV